MPDDQRAMRRAGVVATLTVLAVFGCGAQPAPPTTVSTPGASPSPVTPPDAATLAARLASLVVLPEDLAAIGDPSAFERFDEGRVLLADQPGGARSDPLRFGRLGGWKARYRRTDSADRSGILVVDSRVDLFADASGAARELDAMVADAPRTGARAVAPPQSFGDSTVALVIEQPAAESVGYTIVAWRRGPFVGWVQVSGFRGRVSLEDAMALVQGVDARLSAAGG
jgi:hypothetical protein